MFLIFLVILLDLIGFGIMIPLLPNFAMNLGGGAEIATLCIALYAVGIMIGTPILGRISDFYGRRPVLLLSMTGSIIGYIALAYSNTILMVALARFFSGLMAGNVATAQAYITDITTEENRAKGMGMIGAAFGLGFIFGPFLGSFLAGNDYQNIDLWLAGMVSAGLSAAALLLILIKLPESLSLEAREKLRNEERIGQIAAFKRVTTRPVIFALIVAILIYNTAAGMSESILPIWAEEIGIARGPEDLRMILLVAGLTLAIVQGGLVGPLARKFGEKKLVLAGLLIVGIGLTLMGINGGNGSYIGVVASLSVQSAGAGLVIPSLQSLVSMRAGETERGMVMGVYSTAGMMGRALGTVLTGVLFANIHIHAPYFSGAILMVLLIIITLSLQKRLDQRPQTGNS